MIEAVSEVELWSCTLDLSAASHQEANEVLSDDEIGRAGRYRFARDRWRFVAGRHFLRRTLAGYLSVRPRDLTFAYGPFGKPTLVPRSDGARLEFNLSHSGNLAVLAISRGPTVGVDIEQVIPVSELDAIASRFFSAFEKAALSEVPTHARDFAFYCCWTRKEAFLKALGDGLAHPLDSFDVSLNERSPSLIAVRSDREAPSGWTLAHLCPAPGYVGALAAHAKVVTVTWQSRGRCEEGS